MKSLKEWQSDVHSLSVEKGWYETSRTAAEYHMLFVTEISEATEAVRADKPSTYVKTEMAVVQDQDNNVLWIRPDLPPKPEGEAVELADCVIRILDYFQFKGWDIESVMELKHEYNKTRPHRHGGKKL